jgi:multiple sugar transport system permease protein
LRFIQFALSIFRIKSSNIYGQTYAEGIVIQVRCFLCIDAVTVVIYFVLSSLEGKPAKDDCRNEKFIQEDVKFSFGSRTNYGLIFTILLYLLIAIGFVYLYPLLFMFVTSMKTPGDQYPMAMESRILYITISRFPLEYPHTGIVHRSWTSVIRQPCSLVGYGLARYRFWGKNLLFLLILATFIIPAQNTVIPQMLTYKSFGLLGNIFSLILPAIVGQGYKSAIFILIFSQTFQSLPKVLEEAARLDGASDLKIFIQIALPAAIPAFIISLLFSVVWYWNETYLTVIFLEGGIQSLPMQLSKFVQAYENLYPPGTVNIFDRLNDGKAAGTF